MQHWTKNGSIPSTETDGTEGWQHAPEPPTDVPDGKELVWLNWEWIVRDPSHKTGQAISGTGSTKARLG